MQANQKDPTIGATLREVTTSAKDLMQSEIALLKAETAETASRVGRHATQAAIFGGLLGISVLPFMAFLVIGLGRLFNGNYWLSSLIVSVVCATVGGIFAYRAYKNIKEEDMSLPRSREGLEIAKDSVQRRSA